MKPNVSKYMYIAILLACLLVAFAVYRFVQVKPEQALVKAAQKAVIVAENVEVALKAAMVDEKVVVESKTAVQPEPVTAPESVATGMTKTVPEGKVQPGIKDNKAVKAEPPAQHQDVSTVSAEQDHAVQLARDGQYQASLEIFRFLTGGPEVKPGIWYDYAAILAWAGHHEQAVQVYEEHVQPTNLIVPNYVRTSIAGSYYRLSRFNDASKLYHDAAAAGDAKARLWEAQSLAQMGNSEQAELIYQEILQVNPDNTDALIARARLYLAKGDTTRAANDFDKAIEIAARDAGSQGVLQQNIIEIDNNDMPGLFIKNGEYAYAIHLLKPFIDNGTATITMQCDYILALFLNGEYKMTITEGNRLWSDYRQAPVYGRRALANAYFKSGELKKAIPIYQSIMKEIDVSITDKRSLAYAYLLTSDEKKGLALYSEILDNPTAAAGVAVDASTLIGQGQYYTGKQVFQLTLDRYPNEHIVRQKFAAVLSRQHMPREAYQQFKLLPKDKIIGPAGIVDSALNVGDYLTARKQADYLAETFPDHPEAAYAVQKFKQRPVREAGWEYSSEANYKNKEVHLMQIGTELRVSDRLSFLAGVGQRRLIDNEVSAKTNLLSGGLRYIDMNKEAALRVYSHDNSNKSFGYQLDTQYFFGDQAIAGLSVYHMPVEDAQAFEAGIMATSYNLNFSRYIGRRDIFHVNIGKEFLSDSNSNWSFSYDWDHAMLDTDQKYFNWNAYVRRASYKNQEINGLPTVYESPDLRESYGIAFRHRWTYPKHYWEGRLDVSFGRDRPEPIDFAPRLGVEYGYNFNPAQSLVVGAEYGLRTSRLTSPAKDLFFGYRRYYAMYNARW